MGGDGALAFCDWFNGSAPRGHVLRVRSVIALRGQILMLSLLVCGPVDVCGSVATFGQHAVRRRWWGEADCLPTCCRLRTGSQRQPGGARRARHRLLPKAVYKLYFLHFACTIAVLILLLRFGVARPAEELG